MSGVVQFVRRRWIVAAAGGALILAVVWAGAAVLGPRSARSPTLEGSGRIEGTEILVSARIPGRLVWLGVDEGDAVAQGRVLARLSDDELRAQVRQAEAQVLAAQAQVLQADAAVNAARQQVLQALTGLALARIEATSNAAKAAAGVDVARTRNAQARSAEIATQAQVDSAIAQAEAGRAAAVARVLQARAAVRSTEQGVLGADAVLTKARKDLDRLASLASQGAVSAMQVDAAQAARDASVAQHYAAEGQLQQARAALAQAEAAVQQAEAAVAAARSGREMAALRRQDVVAAAAGIRQAEAAAREAEAGSLVVALRRQDVASSREQLARAEALRAAADAQRLAAEAARDQVKVLLGEATIVAPVSGTVVRRVANRGELIAQGMPILTLVDLRHLTLRIYVTGADLGKIRLGDRATVTVDAFPGRLFGAVVSEIAQQAEFTPKTVHMKDERARLVYGVKLRLRNTEGYLKPGMPADARIEIGVPAAAR